MRVLIVSLLLLSPAVGLAAGPIGQVKTVSGTAFLVRQGARIPVKVGVQVNESDVVETGADGSVAVTFSDNSQMTVGPNSQIGVEQYRFNSANLQGNFLARMRRGVVAVNSGDIARNNPNAMQVVTPRAVLGVRGTTFLVKVTEVE